MGSPCAGRKDLVPGRYGRADPIAFRRSMRMPVAVDPEQCDAKFDRGVLTITMKKATEGEVKTRQIPIKAM